MSVITPTRAATDILKAWFFDKPEDEHFPVDCRSIAEGFGITVHGDDLGMEFEGGLFIQPSLTAIIYNTNIREGGRKNFTLGHELGHFFLHKDRKELRCSLADLTDFGANQSHPTNFEQEANHFAAALLMPSADFRRSSRDREPSIALLSQLAQRYQTSLTATAYRMVELVLKPLALVIVKEGRVHRWQRNEQMKQTGFWLNKGDLVPDIALSVENMLVDTDVWLAEQRAPLWLLKQSSVNMRHYGQTLILISAEPREYEQDFWDDVPDSVDLLPRW